MAKLDRYGNLVGNTHLQQHAINGADHTGTIDLTQIGDGLITEAKLDTATQNKINAVGNVTAGDAINRPTVPTVNGQTYMATDTNILYIGVGVGSSPAWVGVELS